MSSQTPGRGAHVRAEQRGRFPTRGERPRPLRVLISLALLLAGATGCYRGVTERDLRVSPSQWTETQRSTASGAGSPTPCSAGGRALARPQAVAMALAHDANLARLEAEIQAARAQIAVPAAPDHEIRVGTVRIDRLLDEKPRFGAGVRFRFDRPGTIDAATDIAWLDSAIVTAERDEARLTLVAAVSNAYLTATAATARAALVDTSVALARRALARAETAEAQAAGDRMATASARLSLANALANAAQVRTRLDAANAELARQVGLSLRCSLALDPPSAPSPPTEAVATLVQRAWAQRPALRGALAALKQAEPRIHSAQVARYPWFDFAQVEYFAGGDGDPGTAFGFSFGVSVPLFRGSAAVEAAQADALVRRRRMDHVAQQVAAEVEAAVAGHARSTSMIEALGEALAAVDEAGLDRLRADADAGRINPDDVLRLTQRQLALKLQMVEAEHSAAFAEVKIRRALGTPSPQNAHRD
jgi:outer membrane protein TolC